MSKVIHKYGGDIVHFLGNSLVAVWPRVDDTSDPEESELAVARRATQCALDIKNESNNRNHHGSGTQMNEIVMGLGWG